MADNDAAGGRNAPSDVFGSSQQSQHSPAPPVFDPMPSHHAQLGSSLGQGVVPDLMRVYESLTKSSTPQNPIQQQVPAPQAPTPTPGETQNVPPQDFQPARAVSQQQHQQHSQPSQQLQPAHYQYNTTPQFSANPAPPTGETAHSTQTHTLITQTYPQQQAQFQYEQNIYSSPEVAAPVAVPSTDPNSSQQQQPTATTSVVGVRTSTKKRVLTEDESGVSKTESSTKSRKKGAADGRWSKRFSWPDELHRDFVSAVFDVGLKHSSPSAILEQMPKHDQITSERIKSHLQKYRLHRQKSKKEFMASYDTAMAKFKAGGLTESVDVNTLSCGEVAAHLSFSAINNTGVVPQSAAAELPRPPDTSVVEAPSIQSGVLQLPQLSDEEKNSPIGACMGYLMGLFFSLRQQLHKQREAGKGAPPQSQQPYAPPGHNAVGVSMFSETSSQLRAINEGVDSSIPSFSSTLPTTRAEHDHEQSSNPGTSQETGAQQWATTQSTIFVTQPQPQQPQQQQQQQQPQHQQHQHQHQQLQAHNVSGSHSSVGSHSNKPMETQTMAATHQTHQALPPSSINLVQRPPAAAPRASVSLEESHMMKREMQNQKMFQNKMRALKQQELNKCKTPTNDSCEEGSKKGGIILTGVQSSDEKESINSTANGGPLKDPDGMGDAGGTMPSNRSQGAGESAGGGGTDTLPNKIGPASSSDEFWNTDVLDEQLFEFLMNTG